MAEISDVIIQNTAGIPYFAKCYGGDYCKMHADHSLLTGFFAAINSFKGEFNQKALKMINFDELTLVMEQCEDFLVIIGTDEFDLHPKVRTVAKEVMDEFNNRFGDKLSSSYYARIPEMDEFESWMQSKIGNAMADLSPLIEKRKENFLGRIKNRFSRK